MKGVIHTKLAARYYGAFKIIQRIGKVAYRLQLPAESKVHPILHVSQLKKKVGQHPVIKKLSKELEGNAKTKIVESEEILQSKLEQKDGSPCH